MPAEAEALPAGSEFRGAVQSARKGFGGGSGGGLGQDWLSGRWRAR